MEVIAFSKGDVVCFNRGQYSHLALYAGDGRVVHLWSPTDGDFQVRVDSVRYVQRVAAAVADGAASDVPECYTTDLDTRMLAAHGLQPFGGDEVVRRAMSRLGETHYDYLSHNCEHFVTWARYGYGASPQVTSNANQVLAGAMVGAVVGGVAGFVVGGLISLFTKADALSASVGAGAGASMSSGFLSHDEEEEEGGSEQESDTGEQVRRAARELLWNELPAACAPAALDAMTQMEEWVETRRRRAAAHSARKYSDERHNTLANRLAEDELQCGYGASKGDDGNGGWAFWKMCYTAFQANLEGEKSCPYCRVAISEAEEIHKSTKLRAKHILKWDD
ncbi:hypothetical protein BBJ28_00012800 [Nothophytophthora sp. Chile5]|nr:hypothetical protein BBJ28_00012800 [Nothophytophthora sp. Chile5]